MEFSLNEELELLSSIDFEQELLLFNDERNEGGTGVELGEDEIDFEGDGR